MRFHPDSITGKRLRKHGVTSRALRHARVWALLWPPISGLTIPLPWNSAIVVIGRKRLERELDGHLADSAALAPLAHQMCHVHQRLEWGFPRYLWRHMGSRLLPKGAPVRRRQVEREAYLASLRVREFYGRRMEG